MLFNISDNKVSFDLFGKTAEYDKIPFALYQLSEAFEIKIKEDVEQLKKNRENGQPLLITNEGYNAEGKLATSYKVIPWAWDNIDEVKGMMRNIGSFVSKTLSLYGIKLNPNWQHISAPWVTRATEISDIMNKAQGDTFQLAAQNLANTYQRAYNEELAKDYGLSFGILSSSFTAHLVYAAQATAKEMKDKERAAEVASAMTGDPMAHIVTKVFEVIYPLYMNSAEPALIKLLGEYYSYVLSLLAKELGYDFDAVISKFDMEASSKALEKHEGKEAIFAALKKNPSNGVVIGYAIENDLLDDELCDYAKKASPIFMERVVNWAITVLAKIYNEGKLFNKPLINDDNRKIVIGLMRFFKSENPNLVENENWQNVLMGAFTYEVGKHLTDLGEVTLVIASPLDFDARARSGKKFTLSKETKAMFVFLCNELFFSSAYTSASFLGIKTPLSIEAIDKSLNDWNKKLDERAAELAKQAEADRLRRLEEEKEKYKQVTIGLIVGAFVATILALITIYTDAVGVAVISILTAIGLLIGATVRATKEKALMKFTIPSVVLCVVLFFGILSLNSCRTFGCLKAKSDYYHGYCYEHYNQNRDKIEAEEKAEKEKAQQEKNEKNYQSALALLEQGKYDDAYAMFEELGAYKDSATQIKQSKYNRAVALYNAANYDQAIALFNEIPSFSDVSSWVVKCNDAKKELVYKEAQALYDAQKYEEARNLFVSISGYKDSSNKATQALNKYAPTRYQSAESYLDSGNWFMAAKTFYSIKGYSDAEEKCFDIWRNNLPQTTITTNGSYSKLHTYAVTSSGTILATGKLSQYGYVDLSDVLNWTNIKEIAVDNSDIIGLKTNGTVVSTGAGYTNQLSVSSWRNVVQIAMGGYVAYGVKEDGTVYATEFKTSHSDFKDCDYGQDAVSDWYDIVYVSAGTYHVVGLRADGTVVAVGKNDSGQCDVQTWTDIVSISTGLLETVGVKSDGTVVATKYTADSNYGKNILSWKNIASVSVSQYHYVGLKKDGTVVAVGSTISNHGELSVNSWSNITAIATGYDYTIGLTEDGTLLATGNNHSDGRLNVSGWANIQEPYYHIWGSWQVKREATCTTNGYKERTCSDCGASQTETILAGHNYTEVTCTADSYCTRCLDVKTTALGHTDDRSDYWQDEDFYLCDRCGYNMVGTLTVTGEIVGRNGNGTYVTKDLDTLNLPAGTYKVTVTVHTTSTTNNLHRWSLELNADNAGSSDIQLYHVFEGGTFETTFTTTELYGLWFYSYYPCTYTIVLETIS